MSLQLRIWPRSNSQYQACHHGMRSGEVGFVVYQVWYKRVFILIKKIVLDHIQVPVSAGNDELDLGMHPWLSAESRWG